MRTKLSFDELVEREARRQAADLIEAELQKLDLPLPKESNLEVHIDQLLKLHPQIREMAKSSVEAKTDAYTESLAAIGLETPTGEVVDIEI